MGQETDGLNIDFTHWPYFWLGSAENDSREARWAVFFGNDFYNTVGIDPGRFIAKTNQCLNYIRKNCKGYKLIYRPHPDERDEYKSLDLNSFSVSKDDQLAEAFCWSNKNNIKYVFSVCSTSSLAGFNMGLNAYSFYRYFGDVFRGIYGTFFENYFAGLPPSFFIRDLGAPLLENKVKLIKDNKLLEDFTRILAENIGPIWFIVMENRLLFGVLGLARMIREFFPERKMNLVVSRHHRWTDKILQELRDEFNEVLIFPRLFYSLKPSRLISALITSRKIKKVSIEKGSVIVGFAYDNFIENCFVSYNKDKFRASFVPEAVWKCNFRTEEFGFDLNKFVFNWANFFYNRFFEPLLGLNQTMFMHYSKSSFYIVRPQKPIEQIYDKVYLIKNAPAVL